MKVLEKQKEINLFLSFSNSRVGSSKRVSLMWLMRCVESGEGIHQLAN